MLKNFLYLSDTCISSGTGQTNAIQSCTITECVNSGEELTMGSTCCTCLEVKIIAPSGGLNIAAGTEVKLSKAENDDKSVQVGVFRMEKPTQASPNIYKITAYDNVSKLDKDLSAWLKGLEWPKEGYPLITFAGLVCKACGLALVTTQIPNGDFMVRQFYKAGVTGRQLMKWIGEIACRFCRANAAGEIELAWYTDSGVTIRPTGDRYYFAGALTYEDYTVAPIDAVRLRLADSDDGALWPNAAAENPYIITSNPILMARVTEELLPVLQNIQTELAGISYTPCKVSLPAGLDIRAGNTVEIIDKNGKSFTTYVMTKTQSGQRDTLECTGSPRRDSSTAVNGKTPAEIAQERIDMQTQEEMFNKLTNNGKIQGIYHQDGKWYINAELAKIINLIVDHVLSVDGNSSLEITGAFLRLFASSNETFALYNFEGVPVMYMHDFVDGVKTDSSELSPHHLKVGGTSTMPVFYVAADGGKAKLWLNAEMDGKELSWKDNGDGTYTLIGM